MQELSHEVPMSMTDSQWLFLLNIRDIVEKEAFIRSVYYQELNQNKMGQCNESMNYEKGKVRVFCIRIYIEFHFLVLRRETTTI